MKKLFFVLAAGAVIVSCKKVTAGGNHGVLKLEEGVERYDDQEVREAQGEEMATVAPNDSLQSTAVQTAAPVVDSTVVEANQAH